MDAVVRRLLTAAVAVPLALFATFLLPSYAFFLFMVLIFGLCSVEYIQLLKPHAPNAPLWLVPVGMPPVAAALCWALTGPHHASSVDSWLVAAMLLGTTLLGALMLGSGTPMPEVPATLGIVAFGIPYFALPVA